MALASTIDPGNSDPDSIIRAYDVARRFGARNDKTGSGSEREVETTTIQLSHGIQS
jgi:hypothetical protein